MSNANPNNFSIQPPKGSVLGINYSGMHDSAIAIVSPEGEPVFATSLERLSRIKQDGRSLKCLLNIIDWERISTVAISAPEFLHEDESVKSSLLSTTISGLRPQSSLMHGEEFYDFLKQVPCPKKFIGHQEAHASSAFWGSGFDEALCLTYDGGMLNDSYFGGLFWCSKTEGIRSLDKFNAFQYAKITTLYTFVTMLLGFLPLRHEGKITGLAAYGKSTIRCKKLLEQWFTLDYADIENSFYWANCYQEDFLPQLLPNNAKLIVFREQIHDISKEELAATMQNYAENHIIQIFENAKKMGWNSSNICLAGGLFANVKINQKVVETGFKHLFVAPPMTDDGTALGAAWQVVANSNKFKPKSLHSMFLGNSYDKDEALDLVENKEIIFSTPVNAANEIAKLLAQGSIVAVFQGAMEFGPRSLGNRSILAEATEVGINSSLNKRLNRTEFMPFAPMTCEEDAEIYYNEIDRVRHASEFMTVTVNCTEQMKKMCPAVVHVDGTARPQIIGKKNHPFIHELLTSYKRLTGNMAIVNTSFNIHEEPIVCTPEDALRGFFESGLDYLYIEGVGIISFSENKAVAIKYLQDRAKRKNSKELLSASAIHYFDSKLYERTEELIELRQTVIERDQLLNDNIKALKQTTEELISTRKAMAEINASVSKK